MADGATDLELARSGDREAFGRLVKQYQRRVYAAALHLLGSHADADDAAQETFVRAYRGLATFDGRADFFTWLYRIAVNTSLNFMRSGRRTGALSSRGGAEAAHLGGRPEALGRAPRGPEEQHALSAETRRTLEAVAALSPPLRVTLVLSAVEGLPHHQVAEILDVPEGTVGWRISEARRLLRLRLRDADEPEEARARPRSRRSAGEP
ncbi:MAG: sigma-70 family RNA polymerase sigma factor [Kofleriaceae bacterium]